MDKAVLVRVKKERKQTLGSFHLYRNEREIYEAATIELPYKANQRNISCIPVGTYQVKKRNSPRYGLGTFEVLNVPGRSLILLHAGNYYMDTKGCIIPGAKFKDINRDGLRDVINSRVMVDALEQLTDEFTLTVIEI
uniref:DUF5675 family protein n=1 Tax=uncultured Draconibacterium sp. TaxID=1573823 RepID=UPI003216D7C6